MACEKGEVREMRNRVITFKCSIFFVTPICANYNFIYIFFFVEYNILITIKNSTNYIDIQNRKTFFVLI